MSLNLITHEDHFDEQINKNLLAKWYSWALFLAGITVFYNLLEGVISVWFGFNDETLALFGFGLDSFIEVL